MSLDIQVINEVNSQQIIDSEAITLNPPDPYRFPVISCKSKNGRLSSHIYVHSHSEIPSIYEPLFNTSRKILRKNIEQVFGTESGNISYELLMCGLSPETARPALVVKCAVNVMEKLQKVLAQEKLLKRCHLRPRGAAARFLRRFKQSVGIDIDEDELTLGLEIYGCGTATRPPVRTELRGRIFDTFDADTSGYSSFEKISPLYGAKVNDAHGSASATLSGVIQIGGEFFGLTTSHPFRSNGTLKSRHCRRHRIGNMKGRVIPVEVILQDHGQVIQTKVWVPSITSSISTVPNLDWALVLLDSDILDHSLKIKALSSERSLMSTYALKHPGWEPDVLILSFGREPKRGMLLEGTVYFTTGASTEVGVWTLALDEDDPVRKGDSGSLVVDANTGIAYGYLVALDTFGRAEIIPMKDALQQISSLTGIDHVTFAEEVSTVKFSTQVLTGLHLASPTSSRAAPTVIVLDAVDETKEDKTANTREAPLEATEAPTRKHKDESTDITGRISPKPPLKKTIASSKPFVIPMDFGSEFLEVDSASALALTCWPVYEGIRLGNDGGCEQCKCKTLTTDTLLAGEYCSDQSRDSCQHYDTVTAVIDLYKVILGTVSTQTKQMPAIDSRMFALSDPSPLLPGPVLDNCVQLISESISYSSTRGLTRSMILRQKTRMKKGTRSWEYDTCEKVFTRNEHLRRYQHEVCEKIQRSRRLPWSFLLAFHQEISHELRQNLSQPIFQYLFQNFSRYLSGHYSHYLSGHHSQRLLGHLGHNLSLPDQQYLVDGVAGASKWMPFDIYSDELSTRCSRLFEELLLEELSWQLQQPQHDKQLLKDDVHYPLIQHNNSFLNHIVFADWVSGITGGVSDKWRVLLWIDSPPKLGKTTLTRSLMEQTCHSGFNGLNDQDNQWTLFSLSPKQSLRMVLEQAHSRWYDRLFSDEYYHIETDFSPHGTMVLPLQGGQQDWILLDCTLFILMRPFRVPRALISRPYKLPPEEQVSANSSGPSKDRHFKCFHTRR